MICTSSYKGYIGSYQKSVEDNCVHGRILYINDLVTYEAEDTWGIQAAFEAAVDHYIETCKTLGDTPNKSAVPIVQLY